MAEPRVRGGRGHRGAASLPGEAVLVRLSSCHHPQDAGTQTLIRTAGPGGRGGQGGRSISLLLKARNGRR